MFQSTGNKKNKTLSMPMTTPHWLRRLLLGVAAMIASSLPVLAQGVGDAEPSGAQIYAGVAASVNDEPITMGDVSNRARLILLSLGVAPNEQTILQAQQRALEGLIDEKLQIQEASQWEIEITEAEIQEDLIRLASGNNMTLDQFLGDLTGQGIDPATIQQQMRADIAWQRLVGGRYGSRVRISDLQISDRLARLEKTFHQEQMRVSEIFLPAYTREQMSQMVQGAWDLKKQIEEGAPFALVARQFSAAPTASNGGDLGWLTQGQLKTELASAVGLLSSPGISDPVVTEDGVYLVALMERREPVRRELAGFDLIQVEASSSGDEAALNALDSQFNNCRALNEVVEDTEGLRAVSLGDMMLSDLAEQYVALFSDTEPNSLTPIMVNSRGKQVRVGVCERLMTGPALPSRREIESRLREQQVALLADRYLRDLKREATILRR